MPWKKCVSTVSTCGVAGFDPTLEATATRPDDPPDALAEVEDDGLALAEPVADAEVVGAADVEVDGAVARMLLDRLTSAYAPPPAASTTSTATMMSAAFAPPEDWRLGGG
jgi:hypothetical protein